MNKFNTLTPDANEMNFPSKSIGHIEAALKNISDLVHENEIHKEYSNALQNRRTGDVKMKLKMKILMNLSIPFFYHLFYSSGSTTSWSNRNEYDADWRAPSTSCSKLCTLPDEKTS